MATAATRSRLYLRSDNLFFSGMAAIACRQLQISRMIGRSGEYRAISLNPALANVDAKPVDVELGDTRRSSGYASSATASARLA